MQITRFGAGVRAWCFGAAIVCAAACAGAEDGVWDAGWDRFGLPSGYEGTIEVLSNGEHSHWIEFASHRDWAWRRSFRDRGDQFGSLIDLQIGTRTETWRVDPVSSRATRSDGFAKLHQLNGELSATPMAIARALVEGEGRIGFEISADGMTTLRVDDEIGDGLRLEIDMEGDRLVGFRRLNANGDFVERVTYEDWTTLGDGSSVPMRVVQLAYVPLLGSPIRMEFRVDGVRLLDPGDAAPPYAVPDGYFVFDRIEGVIKESDGSVISELGADPVPVGSERDGQVNDRRRSRSIVTKTMMVRTLIGGGVVMVLIGLWMKHRGRA